MATPEMAKELMKTTGQGMECFMGSEVPFAHNAAAISDSGEGISDCCFAAGQAHAWIIRSVNRVSLKAKSLAIPASDKCGPTGATNGVGDIATGEANPLSSNCINVGGRDVGAAIKSDVSVAEIIGHDDDEVRGG